MPAVFLDLQGAHRLEEQLEVLAFDGLAQAGDPLQLALVLDQRAIGRVEQVHAIAAQVLRREAGAVGPVQRLFPVADAGVQGQHADARVQAEGPSARAEDELLHRLAYPFGLMQRGFAVFLDQQHGELVAADAAQLGLRRHVPEQVRGQLA